MVHFTNKDIMKKRHYWRLDSKSITMFKVKEQLSECTLLRHQTSSLVTKEFKFKSKFRGCLCIFLSKIELIEAASRRLIDLSK